MEHRTKLYHAKKQHVRCVSENSKMESVLVNDTKCKVEALNRLDFANIC